MESSNVGVAVVWVMLLTDQMWDSGCHEWSLKVTGSGMLQMDLTHWIRWERAGRAHALTETKRVFIIILMSSP